MNPSDWGDLWRELASRDLMTGTEGEAGMVERWRRVARELDARGQAEPDQLLDFILSRLGPEMTVLDVGAGIGRWTVPIAKVARQVTAVEPVAGMRDVLAERVAFHGLTNLEIVAAPWMDADVRPHDVVIAAHATYTTAELFPFTCKMDALARRACYMALRVPAHNGAIGELSEFFHGRWHDSPNFIVDITSSYRWASTPTS
jgi:FkbM family methyltransferase